MPSLVEKGISLGLGLVAASVLMSVVGEKLEAIASQPNPSLRSLLGPGAAAAVVIGPLGYLGRRWIVRRFFDRHPAPTRNFAQRRRADPPPPRFGA